MDVTGMVIAITVAIWVIYDIVAYSEWGNEGTISVKVWTISQEYPIVPFLFGIVCGHFFWQMHLCA